jgi:hypothetical protein
MNEDLLTVENLLKNVERYRKRLRVEKTTTAETMVSGGGLLTPS